MKKFLFLIAALCLMLGLLISCSPNDSEEDPDNSNQTVDDNFVWSQNSDTVIIVAEEDKYAYSNLLATHISELTGRLPTVSNSEKEGVTGRIVLGNLGDEVSEKAYKRFNTYYDAEFLRDNGSSAWMIYASDSNLVVAYSDIFAMKAAVEYITENLKEADYAPKSSVVARESFDTKAYIAEIRSADQDPYFKIVGNALGKGAENALRNIYTLYDEDLYIWLANLWDPDTGGFYYSASARNNEGFLPDLESTAQATTLLERSGLANEYRDWTQMLPDEMKAKMLEFAKGLQAEDGYFYHPQWGTGISSSRRGRDAGWAKRIITDLGGTPNYPYIGTVTEETSAVRLSAPLSFSGVQAVSKVVAVASNDAIYSSKANFIAYLDSLKFNENSYSAGNTINSTVTAIKNAGMWDTLKAYLIEHQNPNNGLWESEVSYQSVNGLMKISSCFGSDFPNADKAMDSAVQILMMDIDDELTGITFVYNPWVAIYNLLDVVGESKRAELREMLYENAEKIFLSMAEKLSVFSKSDGGFSYLRDYSSPFSQDALVAVSGSAESDVNATGIAVSTLVYYMESVFGMEFPSIYNKYDAVYFLDILSQMKTIIKSPLLADEPDVITFDDYNPDDVIITENVVINPAYGVTNNVGDTEIGASGYAWFESAVVPNPTKGEDTTDFVLYVADKVREDAADGEKSYADAQSSTAFEILNMGAPGNCYVFEADMLFGGISNASEPAVQITFVRNGSSLISAWVDIYQYERLGQKYLRIQENWQGADGFKDTEIVAGLPVDEWFNLRIEMYKDYSGEDGALMTKLKFYVDDELAGISDSGHYVSGAYKDFLVSAVRLSYYRQSASSFWIDNVYVAKSAKVYTQDEAIYEDESTVYDDKYVWDFEDGIPNADENFTEMYYNDENKGKTYINAVDWSDELDKLYGTTAGAKVYSENDPSSAANKVLKVYSQNTKTSSYKATMYVDDRLLSEGGKTWEVEFDYYFDNIKWIYSDDFLSVNFLNDVGSVMSGVTFGGLGWEDDHNTDILKITLSNGKILENFALHDANWYTLKLVYHYDEKAPENSMLLLYVLSTDGYVCIANEKIGGKYGVIDKVGFTFHCYDIRGTQYIDNVSVSRTSLEYVYDTPLEGEIDIPITEDNKIYIEGSQRGKGVYYESAISYSGASYDQLVSDGLMAKNTARGDGLSDGARVLSFSNIDGDSAMSYTSYASGNYALNFVSLSEAIDGFVFETDLKFVNVDADDGRYIRFTGSTTNGTADAALWAFNLKFYRNPNDLVGGYIVTINNSDQKILMGENVWTNFRFVAEGIENGSTIKLYINGELMITTTLTASIKGINGIELYTSSTYNGHGWEQGSLFLDNTYVSGTGTPPPRHEITESSIGKGEYFDSAIKYEGVTYADLVSSGLIAENSKRGDGVSAGKRTLTVETSDSVNYYLEYKSLGSGNHAINFVSQEKAYDGFVFETDLMLSGIDTTETRAMRFTGSTTNGTADSNLWAFSLRIYADPNNEDCYIVEIAGSNEKVIVKDGSWTSFRLVAHGLDAGDGLELFVNGKSVITTALTASIAGIKGVELYTNSTYGAHGWETGSICLDNTYVGGTGEVADDPTTDTDDEENRNGTMTGENIDQPGWVEN